MKTVVRIPRVLQKYSGGKLQLALSGDSVGEVLQELQRSHPAVYDCVCDETGKLRQHINLFLNDDLLVVPNGLNVRLSSGDVISVFQAVSGG